MTAIARPSDIRVFRRESKALVVHPATCAWLVCDDEAAEWLEALPARPAWRPLDQATADPQARYLAEAFYDAGLLWRDGTEKFPADLFTDDIRPLNTVVFNVTNGCNLRCSYCYADSTKGKQMPFAVVKRTLDLMASTADYIAIQFSGNGEPLLNWPVLVESFDYCASLRAAGKAIKISLQTNGTLLTAEKAAVLREHVDKTIVSVDGPPEFTNSHRFFPAGDGAYDAIVRGIEILKDTGTPFELSSTVAQYEYLPTVIDWLLRSGAGHIAHNFLWPQGRGADCEIRGRDPQVWLDRHVALLKTLITHNRMAPQPVTHRLVRQWVTNLVSKKRMSKCCRSPCGAGTEMISVDADGHLYPCHAMTKPPLRIGNVMTLEARDGSALAGLCAASPLVGRIMGMTVDAIDECSDCAFRYACGGPCANVVHTRYGEIVDRLPQVCGARRRIWEEMAWLLAEDPEHARLLTGGRRAAPGRAGAGQPTASTAAH